MVKILTRVLEFFPDFTRIVGRYIFENKLISLAVFLHRIAPNIVTEKMNVYENYVKVEKGDIVMDVGAHIGFFTIKAAREVGDKGIVIAIEPEPSNFESLRKIVVGCGLNNVIFVNKAVGSRKGKAKLYIRKENSTKHSLIYVTNKAIEVEVDTLDNIKSELKLPKVDFVKIDVEGVELDVLKGAKNILKEEGVKLSIASYHKLHPLKLPTAKSEFPLILQFLKKKGMAQIWTKDNYYIYAKR